MLRHIIYGWKLKMDSIFKYLIFRTNKYYPFFTPLTYNSHARIFRCCSIRAFGSVEEVMIEEGDLNVSI
jgi:hypothetical protein